MTDFQKEVIKYQSKILISSNNVKQSQEEGNSEISKSGHSAWTSHVLLR